MPAPTSRPAADPFDDIDRDPSDRPSAGSSGDKYIDATRAVSEGAADTDQAVLEDHEGSRVILDEDAAPRARGADDGDPIDETGRGEDDTLR